MIIDYLLDRFEENASRDAVIWNDAPYSYGWLRSQVSQWQDWIRARDVKPGAVTLLEADFSPNAVALLLALIENRCVLVPLTSSVAAKKDEFSRIAEAELRFQIDADDEVELATVGVEAVHPFYARLRALQHPGLVLFSSGSTGESKAAVHDLVPLLEKFRLPRPALRAISFLLYDHIGGVNTMLHTLANGGCLVTVRDRSPDAVLAAIDRHRVDLLPTSPTFINLILLSEAHTRHSLESLKTVTYGTEPMPESTLRRFHELFPRIKLLQTYGLSEVGILRSKSKDSDSLWVKIGGEGFDTRVVDGVLHIQARSAMLGYLNADSPFTEDGWFNTGDAVEVDGEYLRILGRKSELINVGGQKVYPAEVESVIQEVAGVADVTVYGEKNPITGQIVCARVTPAEDGDPRELVKTVKRHCRSRLESFKVPVKVTLSEDRQHSARFKRMRPRDA